VKVKLEIEIKPNDYNKHKLQNMLVDKLYNLCDDWINDRDIPKLVFIVDEEDEVKKEDIN
tara:strand:- start:947 stop:1126 length:180 start_codon:yes stop_codon:yes gene_type:complete